SGADRIGASQLGAVDARPQRDVLTLDERILCREGGRHIELQAHGVGGFALQPGNAQRVESRGHTLRAPTLTLPRRRGRAGRGWAMRKVPNLAITTSCC